jgi:hypothetical protein
MDPNACLAEIRTLVHQKFENGWSIEDADRFYELVQSLDEWLSNGGFLPEWWKLAAKEKHWQHVLTSTNAREYKRGYEDGRHDATHGSM